MHDRLFNISKYVVFYTLFAWVCVQNSLQPTRVCVLGCRHVCVSHEALHEALISHDWEERQTVTERRAGLDV